MKLIGYDSDSVSNGYKVEYRNYGECCYCECRLTAKTKTRDHIYPKSLGGTETKPCCRECNSEKANMTLVQYMQYLGKQKFKTRFRSSSEWPKIDRKIKNVELLMKK